MPEGVTASEKFRSRISLTGQNASGEIRIDIFGTNDDQVARGALLSASPLTFDIYGDGSAVLYRDAISIEPIGDNHWEGQIAYGPYAYQPSFAFDIGGETQHITQSLATTRYAPDGKTAPDFGGAIGVTDSGVEGVDINVPIYRFQETYYFVDSQIGSVKLNAYALVGKKNNAPFKGFAAGECLLLGVQGSKRGTEAWEATFHFASRANVSGLTIGTITGIAKKGWDYLWVRYEENEDSAAKALVKKPLAVYVEKVVEDGDFSLLGIGT